MKEGDLLRWLREGSNITLIPKRAPFLDGFLYVSLDLATTTILGDYVIETNQHQHEVSR